MPFRSLSSLMLGVLVAGPVAICVSQIPNGHRTHAAAPPADDRSIDRRRRPSISASDRGHRQAHDRIDVAVSAKTLFRELAEEFSTFDRLGNLVRRVSQLVKPSVVHIEAHKSEEKGGQQESYDEAGSGIVVAVWDQ